MITLIIITSLAWIIIIKLCHRRSRSRFKSSFLGEEGRSDSKKRRAEINLDAVLSQNLPEIGNFSFVIPSSKGSTPHFFSVHVSLTILRVHLMQAWIFSWHEQYSRVTKNQKVATSNPLEIRHLVSKFYILIKDNSAYRKQYWSPRGSFWTPFSCFQLLDTIKVWILCLV